MGMKCMRLSGSECLVLACGNLNCALEKSRVSIFTAFKCVDISELWNGVHWILEYACIVGQWLFAACLMDSVF